ncbi:hypothetical protein EW146_g718 [Bondarzewia mesenterica]|uniref:Replication protein A C-terminal domain-containing protein n=1 Tax=Bondarzewia mesenterica TaxID=1095465 RepID=A0A4S4MCA9_9AGAM|nr:hypothetical protein EW146_g718 [Bondarzewia mesenterica]
MSAAAFERQIRPIYDAIDTGSNKSALLACNKLLKKYPQNDLLKALKALALVRSQKVEESLVLCDEVLAAKPTDDSTLTAMMHVLRGLGRHADTVAMFEEAFKRQPLNEDLGMQTFFANIRTGNWKAGQQLATKLNKQFHEDRYVYWGVMCAVLQANDPSTPANMREILFKLAHRLLQTAWGPLESNADRLHLYLSLLHELRLSDEARTLLESEQGKAICSRSLACDELRRDIWKLNGWLKEEGKTAEKRISNKDRNWLEFLSVLDVTFSSVASGEPSDSAKEECVQHVSKTRELLTKVAEEDGLKDRSALLALLELEKRARIHGLSTGSSRLLDLMQQYFSQFGDKAASLLDLQRSINVQKLLRHNLQESELTLELEAGRALQLVQQYIEALQLGKDLPKTELQPADDLVVLAGQIFVSMYKLSGDEAHLHSAIVVLEFASKKSPQSYLIHLSLVRIYRLLGAAQPALEHYRLLNVKQVQNDTLSHFSLSRASNFSLAATGDLTYESECLESSQIYMSNSQEVKKGNIQRPKQAANVRQTADFIVRAFSAEKYSQIPDFVIFEDRLDNSLQRDLVKIEHVRMRVTHEPINSDLVDLELVELKFIFDRLHYDNRDFDILRNYQPRVQPSFNDQTTLLGKQPGLGWLWIFLKIYIKAFQHASDLDDTVEEKLLIGDRPKQSNDPENKLPLQERLAMRKPQELAELTEDELAFLNYATDLADWLGPYHDHTRPPPSAVLAEAAKQTELKTGHALKGLELPTDNGDANGHAKKPEDTPPVREPPASLITFFQHMQARFKELVEAKRPPHELLHVATLTQEALILFTVETLRFKNATVVKVHKLGALVQSFKGIRVEAISILKDMSSQLLIISESEGTANKRKAFVDGCKSLQVTSEINHDYILDVAKKVTDARKKIVMSQYGDSNPYYGNTGGGGGYLTGGSPFGSSSGSPGGASRRALAQSLRPLSIMQVHKATQAHTDADWMIDNTEIGQVTIVGRVITIQTQTTNSVYWVDDGTGRVEARFWSDSTGQEGESFEGITEGSYVRVTGTLKTYGNKRYINTVHIRPIKDWHEHELWFHIAEIMAITLTFDRGPVRDIIYPSAPAGSSVNQNTAAGQGHAASAYTAQPNPVVADERWANLPPVQLSIVTYMSQQPQQDEGIHVSAIARAVGADVNAISDALEKLMDEGHIFTTMDEMHFTLAV